MKSPSDINGEQIELKQPRLELRTGRAKPRFTRLHEIIQENLSRESLHEEDASSECSSIIEFILDGPGSGDQAPLRANTLDSCASSDIGEETGDSTIFDLEGGSTSDKQCGSPKLGLVETNLVGKRVLFERHSSSKMQVRRKSRLSKRPVEFYEYNDKEKRTAGSSLQTTAERSSLQAAAEKLSEIKKVLQGPLDDLLIDDDSDIEDEHTQVIEKAGAHKTVGASMSGQTLSRNILADSKPNLTMINEDICETEQSSSVASNTKGSPFYTFASATKKVSADGSFDPTTSHDDLTTGSSRRHARLYKRINGERTYKVEKESAKVSGPISNRLSAGTDDSRNSYANMISSAYLLFADDSMDSNQPPRRRGGSLQHDLFFSQSANGR